MEYNQLQETKKSWPIKQELDNKKIYINKAVDVTDIIIALSTLKTQGDRIKQVAPAEELKQRCKSNTTKFSSVVLATRMLS